METLLTPPDKEYLLQTGLSDLHHEATEWLSELEFCKTELTFLNKLLDKFFLKTKGSQKISELTNIEIKIKAFRNKTLKNLHQAIISHEQHLGVLDEILSEQDEESIREEHRKYDTDIKNFMNDIKKIKKELFAFVGTELKLTANGRK
jgi:hypothetical protein